MSVRGSRAADPHTEDGWLLERQPGLRYLAEFVGTFVFVFAGCGLLIWSRGAGTSLSRAMAALTFGAVLGGLLVALRPVTEAHFNPAVTLGFASAGRLAGRHVLPYLFAQAAGAVLASLTHLQVFGPAAARVQYGATLPSLPAQGTTGMEVVFTFLLVLVALAAGSDPRGRGRVPGVAIGLFTATACLVGGPSHLSLNPARSLGPALITGGPALASLPIYLLAPILGGVLAGLCYRLLSSEAWHSGGSPCDLDEAMKQVPGLSGQTREH